jgi:hypothetical protein
MSAPPFPIEMAFELGRHTKWQGFLRQEPSLFTLTAVSGLQRTAAQSLLCRSFTGVSLLLLSLSYLAIEPLQ